MKKNAWWYRLWTSLTSAKKHRCGAGRSVRPFLENLEDRTLLSGASPFVESINRTNPARLGTNGTSVTYTVTFSEPVTNVAASDFDLALTGTVAGTIGQVSPSSTTSSAVYTVTVSSISGAGTLGLNLVDNNTIHDTTGNHLVQANGAPTFNSTDIPVGPSGPDSVAIARLTGDGKFNLVVANGGSDTVSVLLGNGNGTFQAAKTYAAGDVPSTVVAADVNGDGKPDLVVANYGDNSVSVLLGNGNGTFQHQTTFAAGEGPSSVAVATLNGDSFPDLAVANYYDGTVSVLLGNGDGTFQSQQTFVAGTYPSFIAATDINGDGAPDLALANYGSNSVSVLLGNGDGTFQNQTTFATGQGPTTLALVDVNHDAAPDLEVVNSYDGTVSVLLGNGVGTFQSQTTFAAGTSPAAIAVADINGDGAPDLVVANSLDQTVGVLLGNGDGTFQSQTTFTTGAGPTALAIADVNSDGHPDVVVTNAAGDSVSVLLGNGNGTFPDKNDFRTGSYLTSVAVADINGDGKLDMAVTDQQANTVSVLLGNGDGTFQNPTTFATGLYPTDVVIADVNGDHKPDLIVTDENSNTVSVLFGNGNGTFQAQRTFNAGVYPASLAVADVNGDGKLDLVVANDSYASPGDVSILLGNGNGIFQSPRTFAAGYSPRSVSVADINGDGKMDVVVANYGDKDVGVLIGNGNGTFQSQKTFGAGTYPYSVSVADVNGDGHPDLVVANDYNNGGSTVSVLLGNGNGTFQSQQTFGTDYYATAVAVADVNGDGKPDVVVANYDGTISLLLGNGNGTFQAQQTFAIGPAAVGLVVADVNGDSRPDIVTANKFSSSVSVLTNLENGDFTGQVYTIVSPAAATHFVVSGTASATAGGNYTFTVTAEDQFNETSTAYAGTVHFTTSDSQIAPPTNATLTSGVGIFSMTFKTSGSQTLTATDAAASSISGNSGPITVSAAAPTHLVVNAPATTSAGSLMLFTVSAEDQFNNTATNFSSTIQFSSSDTQAGLTFGASLTSGAGTYGATLETAGNQTLTANAGTLTGADSSITVTPGTLQHFGVVAPSSAVGGVGFTVTVTAEDHYNNTLTNYAGTVNLSVSDTAATYNPHSSTLLNGSGKFSVTLNTSGNQTISANDSQSPSIAGTANVNVSNAGATHFFVGVPSNATAGSPFIFTVEAEDQSNILATGYNGSISFGSSDTLAAATGGLPSNASLSNGIGFFAAALKTAGTQTITASAGTLTGTTNPGIVISGIAASQLVILAALPPSFPSVPTAYPNVPSAASSFVTTGSFFLVTVLAEDQYNNVDPHYSGTVQFTSSDSLVSAGNGLPANGALASGSGTFSATLKTPGNQIITATDVTNSSINGHSSAIVTRGLVVTSFAVTANGFSVSFDKPFISSAVDLYTTGTAPDDVLLTGLGQNISVHGSLLINSTDTGFTFVKTDIASGTGAFSPSILAAGNYTLTLRSFNHVSGFEDGLGGLLDGTDTGHPGTNYQITFSVAPPPVAVGIPDFARGPSNTDAIFFSPSLANGSTFALSYTNPNASPPMATATVTFSTNAATLQSNLQAALTTGGLSVQVGSTSSTPNAVVIATNDTTTGANVLVTFQNGLATAASQLLSSTTAGVSITTASINVSNNVPGEGIPVALSNGNNVTSGSFTLQYNPSLLSITGAVSKVAGASFTVNATINNATSATAVLSFSSPARISVSTTPIVLGSLLATVPLSATAAYGTRQLLHFSSETLSGTSGAIAVTNQDGIQVVAYVGDVLGLGGPLQLSDASAIAFMSQGIASVFGQTLPGFAAYPDVDPVIVGDVSMAGAVTLTDAGLMNQEAGGTAKTVIPYAPAGLSVAPVGPDLALPAVQQTSVVEAAAGPANSNTGQETKRRESAVITSLAFVEMARNSNNSSAAAFAPVPVAHSSWPNALPGDVMEYVSPVADDHLKVASLEQPGREILGQDQIDLVDADLYFAAEWADGRPARLRIT